MTRINWFNSWSC